MHVLHMSRKKKFTIQNKMNDRAMTDKKGNANRQQKGIGQGIHVVAKPLVRSTYSLNCKFDSPGKSGEVIYKHIGGKSRNGPSDKKGGTE